MKNQTKIEKISFLKFLMAALLVTATFYLGTFKIYALDFQARSGSFVDESRNSTGETLSLAGESQSFKDESQFSRNGGTFIIDQDATTTDSLSSSIFGTRLLNDVELVNYPDDEDIEITFNYGFRNIAKSGRILPFSVEINNRTSDEINGSFFIDIPGLMETDRDRFEPLGVEYSFEINLPANEITSFTDTISIPVGTNALTLSIVDEDGNLICENTQEVNLQNTEGAILLVGVLSDTPENLDYLNGISIGETNLRIRSVELDASLVPKDASGLEQFDLMLVSNYDISKLDSEQIQTLIDWMDGGGVLLVGTGADPYPASTLGSRIEGLSIESSDVRLVDMGLRYSRSGPDGATLRLRVCNIFCAGGSVLRESGDLPLLTSIPFNNGIMAITAYDLCDISEFCEEVPEYTEDLISDIFGTSRLLDMEANSGDMNELYTSAYQLLNKVNTGELPQTIVYILVGIIYISIAGVIVYLFLKSHGLSIYLLPMLSIVAFLGTISVWFLNTLFHGDGVNISYALMRESGNNVISDTGFISFSSSGLKDYKIEFPSGVALHPIIQKASEDKTQNPSENDQSLTYISTENMNGNSAFNSDTKTAKITVSEENAKVNLFAFNMKPLVSTVEEYFYNYENAKDAFDAELLSFEGTLSGTVTNTSSYDLEDAAILMYGKLVKLGDISNGETILLENSPIMNIPVGNVENVASYISGADSLSIDDKEYNSSIRHSELLSFYMADSLKGHYTGARLVAFVDDPKDMEEKISSEEQLKITGSLLIVSLSELSYESQGFYWTDCMDTEPIVASGNYDIADNTTTGSCVLEYNLGSSLRVTRFGFSSVSDYFTDDSYSSPFSGDISLYNYETSSYDIFDYLNDYLDESELIPYLSPGNTIIARFNSSVDPAAFYKMYLPLPDVTGVMDR